mmetsp:Transcript_89375/g.236341  ORF Transcript_89375/g.236341 Transcript_89375/m.236341 type:complete len:549 (+) Transcript_89375:284-1930(+)
MIDGVAEGEERVGRDRHAVEAGEELVLLGCRQRLGRSAEVLLPLRQLRLLHVALDVPHAGVHPVLALHALLEGQAHHLLVEPQPPGRHFPARQLHAVHPALLAGPHADHHAVLGVPDGVGLRVLDGDRGKDEVQLPLLRQFLLLGHYLLQARCIEEGVVPLLDKAHAAAHAVLLRRRSVACVRLQHDELATLLGLQDLQSRVLEVGRDDAVAHLDLQDIGRGNVDLVRDGNEIPKGAQRVGIPRAHVRGRRRRELLVLDLVDDLLLVAERHADGRAGRADVLERRRGGQIGGLSQLVHQLPGVHRIQQIDVPGRPGHHLEGQLAAHDRAESSGQLVGIASVLQRPLHLESHGLRRRGGGDLPGEPLRHRGVVGRCEGVGCSGLVLAEAVAGAAALRCHLLDDPSVLRRARHDRHRGIVLRRRPDHRRPADVDVLDAGSKVVRVLGDGFVERVQVDHDQVDTADTVLLHLLLVLLVAARSQQAAVHLRVQRLDAAVEDLWGAGVVRHVLHSAAEFPELSSRAAGGEHVDAPRGEELAQLLKSSLVEHRD